MTIRLLAAYGPYPINAIVTLDAGTETGLVLAKLADTNLTGGQTYVTPTPLPRPPSVFTNSAGFGQNVDQRRPYSLLVAGNSLAAFAEANVTFDSLVDNGDGTATATRAAGHQLCPGQPCRVNVASTRALNVMDSVVLSTPSSTVAIIRLGGRTHGVTGGGQPNLIFPWRLGSRSWVYWMEAKLRTNFRKTWAAVGGATSAQVRDLLRITEMEDGRVNDVGILFDGTNDIYGKGWDFATVKAEMQATAEEMRKRCDRLIIANVPPRSSLLNTGSADATWSPAKLAVHMQINEWLDGYAPKIGAQLFDTWGAAQNVTTYVNPASPAGTANPDSAFTVDPTHQSARGAQAWGFGLADLLAPSVPIARRSASHKLLLGTDANNVLTNSDMATDTAGMATNWIASGATTGISVTPSMEARTVAADGDANGRNQVLDIAYGTVASGLAQYKYRRDNLHTLLAPFVGKTVQFRFPCSVQGAVGLQAIELEMIGTTPEGTWRVYGGGLDGNLRAVPGTYDYMLHTNPAVVPPNLQTLSIWANVIIDSTQTSPVRIKLWHSKLGPVELP